MDNGAVRVRSHERQNDEISQWVLTLHLSPSSVEANDEPERRSNSIKS